jgi:DNA-binding winged helix-turn-helix (wHTH) protein
VTDTARFGDFEVDFTTRELRKNGTAVRVQPQAFDVLAALLDRPGRLVTREELRRRLWPADVFVDDENHAVNKAISKLREALDDATATPKFIETLPRRGYRFVGSVDRGGAAVAGVVGRLLYQSRTIALSAGVHIVGRDEGVSLRLDSATVSRRHAKLVLALRMATIEDLGSKNGTRVNDHVIDGVTPLRDGDRIRVGSIALTFRAGASGSTDTLSRSSP